MPCQYMNQEGDSRGSIFKAPQPASPLLNVGEGCSFFVYSTSQGHRVMPASLCCARGVRSPCLLLLKSTAALHLFNLL
jgi:hypothetical protein